MYCLCAILIVTVALCQIVSLCIRGTDIWHPASSIHDTEADELEPWGPSSLWFVYCPGESCHKASSSPMSSKCSSGEITRTSHRSTAERRQKMPIP